MTSQDEELLADLLLRWEELQAEALETSADELAADRPDLVPELARRIRLLRTSSWLDKPIHDDAVNAEAGFGTPASPRKSPHERHASASQFAADLRHLSPAVNSGRAWHRPAVLAALAAAATSCLAFMSWKARAPETPAAFRELMAKATTEFFHSQYEDAEASFSQALRAHPQNRQCLSDRGVCRKKLGRMDEAVEDFSAALVLAPHDHETLRHRAQAYVYLRRYEAAIADLETFAKNFPELSTVPQELATIHAVRAGDRLQAGDPAGAIADLTKALNHKPDVPAYYVKRAECHAFQGDWAAAAMDYTRAISRRPKEPDLYRLRAKSLRELGRDDEAEADEKKVQELTR